MTSTPDLNNLFEPGQPLPSDGVMIAKALEILAHSPHGQQLTNLVEKRGIEIKIITTQQSTTYLPDKKLVYIGFNRAQPVSPARFILMLAGALREAQQEASGIKHPSLTAPIEEHKKVSLSKQEDKLWYMCTIATELNNQAYFTEYKFLDELRKMGHNEALELFIRQEQKNP